jgi:UDPglucose 6-dehydrogenase
MIAVPTASDGRDPTEEVARAVAGDAIVVLRGTLTPDRARALAAAGPVVANPEFLREGHALADFRAPARVVLGGEPGPVEAVATLYARIYGPEVPVVRTDLASACLAKLAANALLAVKVAFGNEVAAVAAESGASVDDVVRILGLDPRIGASHLRPSLGFGGPCLPKDARMLADRSAVVRAALGSNALRLDRALALTEALVGGLAGKRIAVWGLTFKPGTDDVRESRSVELVDRLRAAGAEVAAHDPAALPGDPAAAVRGADALVVATPWPEYGRVDPASLAPRAKVVVDPASLLDQRWSGWVRGS